MADIKISFILCSRNDQFQGDSLWRLSTTINHVARQLALLGRLDEAEVIVSDWGSEGVTLRDAAVLTEQARRITRFLTVPPALAKEKQQDSPFGEVIAINAAARRARGDYIGRIDQDTLVGPRFLRWFFDSIEATQPAFPIQTTAMISNRRRIPYHFAVRTPRFPLVERYVETLGPRVLPAMAAADPQRYWEVYIGIVLFHRDLWADCEGYDESFLYYGYMEFDLFLRLLTTYGGADIGPLVGEDFFHLDHVPAWKVWRTVARKINVMRRPGENEPPTMRPNGPGWGLADHDLPLQPADSTAPVLTDAVWRRGDSAKLATLTVLSTASTIGQIARDNAKPWLGRLKPNSTGL
jgi:glycosyltransferase involved in cell wall biosynthesis